MREPGTIAMFALRGLVQAASRAGVDRRALCAELGLTPAALEAEESVPLLLFARAWQVAPELSGDPLFGLHAGSYAEIGSYDVLDYLFTTSATLGEACASVARYFRIMTEMSRVDLVIDGNLARFRHSVAPDRVEPMRHAWDYFFSGAMKRINATVGGPFELTAVHLMHAPPTEGVEEYARLFGCPVVFGHPIGEFVCDSRYLELPLATASPSLHRLVTRHAEELVTHLPTEGNLVAQAQAALDGMLSDSTLSLASLARAVRVSERTLQRKLAEHGLTYKQLLDQAREEISVRQLEVGALSIAEIAHKLGFASASAFSRAFRRWRGVWPSEYQRQARERLAGRLESKRN